MSRTVPPERMQAVLRGVALGVVAAAHLLGLMLAMMPAHDEPWWSADAGPRHEALQLQLLPPPPPQAVTSTPAPMLPRRAIASSTRHRSPPPPQVPANSVAIAATPTTALNLSLPAQAAGYVAGGADFRGRVDQVKRASPVARLPGSAVPLVKGLPFADPRTQGIAGVVRSLQGIFGLPNKHCIDVDVWRNMTTQERLKHHISASDVEQVAQENGCLWPRGARP